MLIGLVGKPSCGKSTFFKAATLAEVEIASYPFTTIKPNHGVGYVKIECVDKEFDVQCDIKHGFCVDGWRFVPVELMDVAGLVPGASEGKGLGNQFLDDLRKADAFIHIVDASGLTDAEGKPTENYDVCEDIEFLEEELDKWYCGILKKVWRTFTRKSELEGVDFSEAVAKQFSGLKVDEKHVKQVLKKLSYNEKPTSWNDEQVKKFASELRKLSKPMIIAANKSDIEGAKENIEKMKSKFPDYVIVPCSSDSELALREAAKTNLIKYIPGEKNFEVVGDLTDTENKKFSVSKSPKDKQRLSDKQKNALDRIKKNVLNIFVEGTGVQQILNDAVFGLLKYIAVFPVDNVNKLTDSKGNVLPDCFLLPSGSTALDFAYFMHTDFGENFIKAIDARSKKAVGKDYKLKHRDVLEIVMR